MIDLEAWATWTLRGLALALLVAVVFATGGREGFALYLHATSDADYWRMMYDEAVRPPTSAELALCISANQRALTALDSVDVWVHAMRAPATYVVEAR